MNTQEKTTNTVQELTELLLKNGEFKDFHADTFLEKPHSTYTFLNRSMYTKAIAELDGDRITIMMADRFKTHITTVPLDRISDIKIELSPNGIYNNVWYVLDNLVSFHLTFKK